MTVDGMPVWHRLRNFTSAIIDEIMPPACIQCRQYGSRLCQGCISLFQPVPNPICPFCGQPVSQENKVCRRCRQSPIKLKQIRSAFTYAAPLDFIVPQFKYNNMFGLGRPLAELMAAHWPQWKESPELVVPVPLHPERKKKRGYNQAEMLAKHLANLKGLPINEKAIVRVRATKPQVGLSWQDREKNMVAAFEANAGIVQQKSVLLVDDVYTTGATLGEAAQSLLDAGASAVFGYCLAQAPTPTYKVESRL